MKTTMIAALLAAVVITLPAQASISASKQQPVTNALASDSKVQPSKIDLNKADLAQLTGSFKGIGKKRAQAIIDYRQSHNGFKALEELAEVKGLGQHFWAVNKDKLKEVYLIH